MHVYIFTYIYIYKVTLNPCIRLVNNKGDDAARLWWSPLRPGTLRGQHPTQHPIKG